MFGGFFLSAMLVFAAGAWDSGAIGDGGLNTEELKNGTNGKICALLDTSVGGYDEPRALCGMPGTSVREENGN